MLDKPPVVCIGDLWKHQYEEFHCLIIIDVPNPTEVCFMWCNMTAGTKSTMRRANIETLLRWYSLVARLE